MSLHTTILHAALRHCEFMNEKKYQTDQMVECSSKN